MSPPRPSVVFIRLNRLPSPLGMERRGREKMKDLLLWHTVGKQRWHSVRFCLRSICECVCGCLCATLFDFSTLWPHVPLRIASLAAKPKPGKLASRSGIMVELKCPRPEMSIYVIWKTKLTPGTNMERLV